MTRTAYTRHALAALEERNLEPAWIEATLLEPEWVEIDPVDPAIRRFFRSIPDRDGRVLRVAAVTEKDGAHRVLTAFFDRGAKRKA